MNKYKLFIDRQGSYFVKVGKLNSNNEYDIIWQKDLRSDEPLELYQFFSETQFVVVNWKGRVWIFDVEKKEKQFDQTFSTNISAKSFLTDNKNFLYIAYENETSKTAVSKIDLSKIAIETTKEINEINYFDSFTEFKGNFIFYRKDEDWDTNEFEHFFYTYNFESGISQKHILPYPQLSQFGNIVPEIDRKNGKAILAYWGEVEKIKDEKGYPQFVFKIIIYDLNTFEVDKIIPVRIFNKRQLTYSEGEAQKTINDIINPEDKEAYNDAMTTFCENLNNIVIDKVSQAFWVCFRGGIIRKIDYKGNMSPIYATNTRRHNTSKGAFESHGFHSYIFEVKNNGVILIEHSTKHWMAIPDIQRMNAKIDDFISIDITEVPKESECQVIKSEEASREEKERIYNVIEFIGFYDGQDVLDALEEVALLPFKQVGHYLAFLFQDAEMENYEEYEFFKSAIHVEGASEIMEKIAYKALDFGIHGVYGANNEDHALFNLFLQLVLSDKKHASLGFKFLENIDYEHDVENFGEMIDALETTLGKREFKKQLKKHEKVNEWYKYQGY